MEATEIGGAQIRKADITEEQMIAEGSAKRLAATTDALENEVAELNVMIAATEATLDNAQRLRNSAIARLDVLRSTEPSEAQATMPPGLR